MEVTAGLTREQLLEGIAARRRHREAIEVPEWGGTVYVRRLSVSDVDAISEEPSSNGHKPLPASIRTIVACLVDAEGEPLLTEEDAHALLEAEAEVVMRVFTQVAGINGISAPAVREAVEAFGGAQDGATGSD